MIASLQWMDLIVRNCSNSLRTEGSTSRNAAWGILGPATGILAGAKVLFGVQNVDAQSYRVVGEQAHGFRVFWKRLGKFGLLK